jgi:flagellar hook-associated protein 2
MATISNLNSNGLNFSGLSSGIDSQKLIDGLTSINASRIAQLKARQQTITLRQGTFTAIRDQLADVQSAIGKLGRSVAGAFDARKAITSDDALTATAGSSATPGTYTLAVTGLAQAQAVASEGFADPGTQIKEGTLTLRVGSGQATTVTVGPANNTLQGLVDAINNGGGDVRASLINDGSATPYRLLLTSAKTGAANTISVTNDLTGGTGAAINPLSTTITEAKDATIKLGSGPGAITVRSDTNRVNTVIPGVTLNLTKADPAKEITVNVASDTEGAKKAVQEFVDSYNKVVEFIDKRDDFAADTKAAGVLLGSRDATDIQIELTNALTSAVPGVKSVANRLSAIGVTLDEKGKLSVDSSKLDKVLTGQETGVGIADVKRLFAYTGVSTDSGVSFVLGSDKTKPSAVGAPYQVNVTSPATRGGVTGGEALGGAITVDGTNNGFSIVVNGVRSGNLALAAGNYTPSTLAAAVQSVINADPPLQGSQVSVDVSGGRLRITANQYGSSSSVEVVAGGSAVGAGKPLGFAGGEKGTGTNVAGSFTVAGKTETASGLGQILSGSSGNANTDGLQVRVTAAAATTASLDVTQGIASRLNAVLNKYLDPINGKFKTLDNRFKADFDDVEKVITRQNDQMDVKKEALVRQFAAMESAVSKLKGLSTNLAALIPTSK